MTGTAVKEISHIGRIVSAGTDTVTVEIVSRSACASCHAAGLCTASEAATKEITVRTRLSDDYRTGEEVWVFLRAGMGTKAVLLAYVVPLFILLILVVSLSFTDVHELAAGAAGLGGIAVWYLILYCFRDRLDREYEFYIRRK